MMGIVMVDANVLLDVFTVDPIWFDWSSNALEDAAESHELAINTVIYAEVSVNFDSIEKLDAALPATWISRLPISYEAAFLAGKCFAHYRRRGGTKRSPLPGFFIGAHAALSQMTLLTRDAPRYRTYFPKLSLITPE